MNSDRTWWDNLHKIWQKELIANLLESTEYKKSEILPSTIFDVIKKNNDESDKIINDIVNLEKLELSRKVLFDFSPLFYLKNMNDFRLPYPYWEEDLDPEYGFYYLNMYPKELRSRVRGVLDLTGAGFYDVNLEDYVNVEGLLLQNCGIESLDGFQRMTKLKRLDADQGNSFSDLNPLRGLNLVSLNIEFTNVTDISPLIDIPSLEWINLYYLNISDLSPLLQLPNLKGVELPDGNQYTLKELKIHLKQKFGIHPIPRKIMENANFKIDKKWYLLPFDPLNPFFESVKEGEILTDSTAFNKPNIKDPESHIIITDFVGLCANLSTTDIYPVSLPPDALVDKIDEHSWYASTVEILKPIVIWQLLRSSFHNIFQGTIEFWDQKSMPNDLQLPTVVNGNLIFCGSILPPNLSLPINVTGILEFVSCNIPDNLRLPSEVATVKFRNCTFGQGIYFEFIKNSEIYIEECILLEKLSISGKPLIFLQFKDMKINSGIEFSDKFTGNLEFVDCEFEPGFKLPSEMNGRLTIKSPKTPANLKLPSNKGYELEVSSEEELLNYDIPEWVKVNVITDDLPF